ncbi:hypothetical protein AXF42_Ash002661 [Apostasia shenzhenica]|uniref:Uncharacterized protein n=1 Tax=Apostasia shenzhenica TaxID=1088818 RepID=A0A2I0A6Y9_9ASPA|nr:hypothetical protein AXF42_Ash002661 [Apostasia shenzhenica]
MVEYTQNTTSSPSNPQISTTIPSNPNPPPSHLSDPTQQRFLLAANLTNGAVNEPNPAITGEPANLNITPLQLTMPSSS